MLHVTNNTMKKSALTILVLLILSTIGCGDAYKADSNNNIPDENTPCPENASCQILPDNSILINYNEEVELNEAIEKLPSGYGIIRMTAVENEHFFTAAFPESTLDINLLIDEYQDARNQNLDELISIQNDSMKRLNQEDTPDETYLNSIQTGIDKLNSIKTTAVTPTLKIKELLVKEI